ncbi:MAG: TolC family protein [Planctomycetes bacterium]|nr:TolC family protein [Planctomycetota bacterium]
MIDASRIARTTGLILCAALCGCQNELFQDAETPYTAPAKRLHEVGTFNPVKAASQPPETLKEIEKSLSADKLPKQEDRPTRELTLAECRSAALQRNLDLKVQLYNPAIARSQVSQEEAKFEAAITANWQKQSSNLVGNDPTTGNLATDNFTTGLNFPLATGGTFTASALSTENTPTVAAATGTDNWQSGMAFSISQPLLQGAGVEANTASIRVAKLNSQIADARTKLESIRLLANVDKTYWNVYAASRELDVRLNQYKLALAQLERARRRVNAGDAAQIEVIRAESGLGSTIENIIIADNLLRLRQRDLKRLINDPELNMDTPIYVITVTEPRPLGLKFDPEKLAQQAVENRMEMLELELQLAVDATNLGLARNAALPLFTVAYQYNIQGTNDDFAKSWNIGNDDGFTASANANIPLGNEAAKNRVQQAILTRLQRLATRDLRRQTIRQELFNAMDNLQNSWRRILAARLETALAGRTYEAEKRQFDLGIRTSTDVLIAANQLGDAQSKEVTALAGWQISLVDLAFATGTQLGQAQIDWTAELKVPSATEATTGWGAWGVNVGYEEGNQPNDTTGSALKKTDTKPFEMPELGPPVEPIAGLKTPLPNAVPKMDPTSVDPANPAAISPAPPMPSTGVPAPQTPPVEPKPSPEPSGAPAGANPSIISD